LGQRLSFSRQIASWIVVGGAAAYAYEDLAATDQQERAGYLWAGANLLAYVSNSLLDRLLMTRHDQTASGMALCTQALSIPISVFQGIAFHSVDSAVPLSVLSSLDEHTVVALLVTGVGAAFLGNCYAECYRLASATAVTVAGNVNKALSVFVGVVAFGSTITRMQVAGMCVCLAGAFGYSILGVLEKDRAKQAEAEAKQK